MLYLDVQDLKLTRFVLLGYGKHKKQLFCCCTLPSLARCKCRETVGITGTPQNAPLCLEMTKHFTLFNISTAVSTKSSFLLHSGQLKLLKVSLGGAI